MNFEGYTEAHPEPLHARKTELFTKIVALICELFSQNSLSQIFDRVLNTTLIQFPNVKRIHQKISRQKISLIKVDLPAERILKITGLYKKKTL